MGKFTFNLRDFIRGMKKGNYDQIENYLFGIDKKTGNLCGCALGQGILNSGLVDVDEIKRSIESQGTVSETDFRPNGTGKTERRKILVNPKMEETWMHRLNSDLGDDFVEMIYTYNDDGREMPEIIDSALQYEAEGV